MKEESSDMKANVLLLLWTPSIIKERKTKAKVDFRVEQHEGSLSDKIVRANIY